MMLLNEKIAARRKQLVGDNLSNADSSSHDLSAKRTELDAIDQMRGSQSIQEKIESRRDELAKQEEEIIAKEQKKLILLAEEKRAELVCAETWFQERGLDITVEAMKRVPYITYGSITMWIAISLAIWIDDYKFNGDRADSWALIIGCLTAWFGYWVVQNYKKKLIGESQDELVNLKFGIVDNLKSTHIGSYVNFVLVLLLAIAVVRL